MAYNFVYLYHQFQDMTKFPNLLFIAIIRIKFLLCIENIQLVDLSIHSKERILILFF